MKRELTSSFGRKQSHLSVTFLEKLSQQTLPEDVTRFSSKADARQWAWDALNERRLARFPFPPHGRIPNFAGAAVNGTHDGTTFTPGAALGTNPGLPGASASGRGAALAVRLFDGTVALLGGTDGAVPLADTFVYTR